MRLKSSEYFIYPFHAIYPEKYYWTIENSYFLVVIIRLNFEGNNQLAANFIKNVHT